jgi:hypothetical protein
VASVPHPLRRGAATFAIAGSALSLAAATSGGAPPAVTDSADAADAAALLTTAPAGPAGPAGSAGSAGSVVGALPPVEPVALEPQLLDAASLVKAVQLAEREAAEEAEEEAEEAEEAAEEAALADCDLDTDGLGAVKDHVRAAAEFLGCQYGEPTMHGVAGRGGPSDHPGGLAVDFMVDRATGDALADCVLNNMDELGAKYVIWEQRINHGDGWEPMEDRGGVTANHFDHVHVSFNRGADGNPGRC